MFIILRKIRCYFSSRNNSQRSEILKTITETLHGSTLDNYGIVISNLVKDILINDTEFRQSVLTDNHVKMLKEALSESVDNAFKQMIPVE